MKEKLIKLYQEYLGLVFRVGLMITILLTWERLGNSTTFCRLNNDRKISDYEQSCITIRNVEGIFRDVIQDLFPLVFFLCVSYVLFWFVKKR
jgi:hypothetical protein